MNGNSDAAAHSRPPGAAAAAAPRDPSRQFASVCAGSAFPSPAVSAALPGVAPVRCCCAALPVISILRIDVDIPAQCHASEHRGGAALAHEPVALGALVCGRASGSDRQPATVDRHLDGLGIDTREVSIQDATIPIAIQIHRRRHRSRLAHGGVQRRTRTVERLRGIEQHHQPPLLSGRDSPSRGGDERRRANNPDGKTFFPIFSMAGRVG